MNLTVSCSTKNENRSIKDSFYRNDFKLERSIVRFSPRKVITEESNHNVILWDLTWLDLFCDNKPINSRSHANILFSSQFWYMYTVLNRVMQCAFEIYIHASAHSTVYVNLMLGLCWNISVHGPHYEVRSKTLRGIKYC